MGRWLLILCAVFSLSQNLFADSLLDYSRRDTRLHTGFAFVGSFAIMGLLKSQNCSTYDTVVAGAATALSIGLMKETFIDKGPSASDMMANSVGVAASSLFFLSLDF